MLSGPTDVGGLHEQAPAGDRVDSGARREPGWTIAPATGSLSNGRPVSSPRVKDVLNRVLDGRVRLFGVQPGEPPGLKGLVRLADAARLFLIILLEPLRQFCQMPIQIGRGNELLLLGVDDPPGRFLIARTRRAVSILFRLYTKSYAHLGGNCGKQS